jgi:predicted phosphodiesterase
MRDAKKYIDDFDSLAAIADRYTSSELTELAKGQRTVKPMGRVDFQGDRVRILAMTDTHIGSAYTDESYIAAAIDEGMRQSCDIAVHAGDVTEGMSGRDGHVYELSHIGYKAQRDAAVRILSRWKLPLYMCAGNHDAWYLSKGSAGADIVDDICQAIPHAHYLGFHEGDIDINGVKVRLWHGEDVGSYATSYRLQKLIESFSGGEKPAVLLCGHTHKAGYFFERNIHAVTLGSLQKQSAWMRRKRLAAHCGFWILDMIIGSGEVKSFTPTFYPFYK